MSYYQKDIAEKNRNKILVALYEKPMTFTELRKFVNLSKPVLSNHLRTLRERKQITKDLMGNRVVYKLTSDSLDLSIFNQLIFGNEVFFRILSEIIDDNDTFSSSFNTKSRDISYNDITESRSPFFNLFPKKDFISKKENMEIIQAINRWLTPAILYILIQDIKNRSGFRKIVNDLIHNLAEIIKQKNPVFFENALKKYYENDLVPRYFFLVEDKLKPANRDSDSTEETEASIIKVLEEILEITGNKE